MFKRILIPVDGSSTLNRALVAGLRLASGSDYPIDGGFLAR